MVLLSQVGHELAQGLTLLSLSYSVYYVISTGTAMGCPRLPSSA